MGVCVKKTLVISAVNITEGGPLKVLQDCVQAALEELAENWQIYVLVHNRHLIAPHPALVLIEYPLAKRSWFLRLYYEWWGFFQLSKKLDPDIWLSLHDISPHVIARKRIVYCHNPSPFYSISLREAFFAPAFMLFSLLYKYLYRFNIKHNESVIVQQSWIREQFVAMYSLDNVIVAYPQQGTEKKSDGCKKAKAGKSKVFLYPAFPRVFKNFEVIGEAVRLLQAKGVTDFEVRLTVDGSESRYTAWLSRKYSDMPEIKFLGLLNREQMMRQYREADCLIFPSRIETWGLPITEAKDKGLRLLLADLPYAHETVGSYDQVAFFKHDDAADLARCMERAILGEPVFSPVTALPPAPPFADGWPALINKIVRGSSERKCE